MRVGVLALQGEVFAHMRVLRALGHDVVEVRVARDAEGIEGLVLPGGESTSQRRLLARDPSLRDALRARLDSQIPLLATCAGLILSARRVEGDPPGLGLEGLGLEGVGWLDVVVRRNAYGAQRHSAEALADDGARVVLIRAPRILAQGPRVDVLLRLEGQPVLVREGNRYGATFHPELTGHTVHREVFG